MEEGIYKKIKESLKNSQKNGGENMRENKITIIYDSYLEKITGIPFEEAIISENFNFTDFLNSLFVSYPQIPQKIPPGELGFLVNDRRPEAFDILKDGDKILLLRVEGFELTKEMIENTRKEIEVEISNLIQRYKIDISFEKIKEVIFNEKGFKDFHFVIEVFSKKIKNSDQINQTLNVLMKAWNYFPHKSLNGFCPLEKSRILENNPYLKE